jgi:hypothetical protein
LFQWQTSLFDIVAAISYSSVYAIKKPPELPVVYFKVFIGYYYSIIPVQLIRAPAAPLGCEVKSSTP